MKKYVKPELFYERYEPSQNIAACDFDSNNTFEDVSACEFTGVDPDFGVTVTLFTNANGECVSKSESYCYHNNTSSQYKLFNS